MSHREGPSSSSTNARVMGIRSLLDEAHANLPTETLAELLLAVRRTLHEAGEKRTERWTHFQIPSLRPGVSQAARVYLRPIELLVHLRTERTPGLSPAAIRALDGYLDDLAARPRGAVYTATA